MKYSIRSFIFFILSINISLAQDPYMDSLKLALKNAKQDTTKALVTCDICWQYVLKSEYDTALSFCNEAISFAKQKIKQQPNDLESVSAFKRATAGAYNNIGSIYYYLSDYEKAIEFYNKSLEIRSSIKDRKGEGNVYNNLGSIYLTQGKYPYAMNYYLKALKIREEIKDKKGMASCYNNLGIIHDDQENVSEAFVYHNKALALYIQISDKKGMATSFNNIGNNYKERKDFNTALEYYQKSLTLREETKDKKGIASSLNNIGLIYMANREFSKALDCFLRSLTIREGIKDYKGIGVCKGNIGNIYALTGKAKEAIPYLDSSIAIHYRNHASYYLKLAYAYRSQVDSILGDFKSAYQHYKLHKQWSDSVLNEKNEKNLTRSELTYDFEKKENEVKARQEIKDTVVREENRRKSIIIFFTIAVLILVVVFFVFLYKRFRLIQKQKRVIEIQKKEVVAQKEIIEEKQIEILDSINYARRIQRAHLPTEKYISKNIDRLKE